MEEDSTGFEEVEGYFDQAQYEQDLQDNLSVRLERMNHRESKTPTKEDLQELEDIGKDINKVILEKKRTEVMGKEFTSGFHEQLRNLDQDEKDNLVAEVKNAWLDSYSNDSFANYLTKNPDEFDIVSTVAPEELAKAVNTYKDSAIKTEGSAVKMTSTEITGDNGMNIESNFSSRDQ